MVTTSRGKRMVAHNLTDTPAFPSVMSTATTVLSGESFDKVSHARVILDGAACRLTRAWRCAGCL